MVSAARSNTGSGLIIHYKEITAVEMAVHLFDLVLIYNVGFMNTVKLCRHLL
ncbi:MAG: hypothetical protein WDO71_11020 [Bacteroidota bacterium]